MSAEKIQRLALGSVQFGLDYGIANQGGKVPADMAGEIVSTAFNGGIDTIDTAIGYGDSEDCLGKIGIEHFKLVSKLPALPSNVEDISKWVKEQVIGSLSRLNIDQLYGLMLHHPQDLLQENGPVLYKALCSVKRDGLVGKIGVSVYAPEEMDELSESFEIDLVQTPFNLIDRRFDTSGCFKRLKDKDIEIHTRSAFLQGLLLMGADDIPEAFNQWKDIWGKWFQWQQASGNSTVQSCLHYCLSIAEIDRVVVGVNSNNQIQEIISAISQSDAIEFPDISSISQELINPSKWADL